MAAGPSAAPLGSRQDITDIRQYLYDFLKVLASFEHQYHIVGKPNDRLLVAVAHSNRIEYHIRTGGSV